VKALRIISIVILILLILLGVMMFWKVRKSQQTMPDIGLLEGQLKACGTKPNCVSSFSDKNSKSFIEPIKVNNIEVVWDNLNILLPEQGFNIVSANKNYIHATQKTALLGFVDDVEFLLDESQGLIHMRSASRVGYSDLGTNRKRLNKITEALSKL
jgi:uncharacterized protein (DUF1499 family)